MSTKSFDTALDFMPDAGTRKGGPGVVSFLRKLGEAFAEGRAAEQRYRVYLARGFTYEQAARKTFERTYKAAA